MIGLIIAETTRSVAYIKKLNSHKINLNDIFIYKNSSKLFIKNIKKKLSYKNLYFLSSININNEKNIKMITKSKSINIIFSGKSGDIIKNHNLLVSKNIIHCHPGRLPFFRGSTTLYYNVIQKKKIYCTCFVMSDEIDAPKIIIKSLNYKYPKTISDIEKKYDDFIRAETLASSFKKIKFLKLKNKKIKLKKTEPYFICHPVIRSLTSKKNTKTILKNLHFLN